MKKVIILAFLMLFFFACNGYAKEYEILDLGTLGGWSPPWGINNQSQVVGYSSTAEGQHAFLWDSINGMRDLGTLGGGFSAAWDINETGQVVGASTNNNQIDKAFVWDETNGIKELSIPGSYSRAYGVNNQGQIAGKTKIDITQGSEEVAYVYDDVNGFFNIGWSCGWHDSLAQDINDSGQVVGRFQMPEGNQHVFIWDSINGVQDIGTLGGSNSIPYDINNLGQIVGNSVTQNGASHAFLWDNVNGIMDLGSLGAMWSDAYGINSFGQVVGSFGNYSSKAFIWDEEDGMRSLSDLISGDSGWDMLNEAHAINDLGEIVGLGSIGGKSHAFLLRPNVIPEPPTMLLLGFGVVPLLCRRKR